jgi:hypothetical protein
MKSGVSRRDFLKTAAAAAGVAVLPGGLRAAATETPAKEGDAAAAAAPPLRTLGRTGLKISTISIGTGVGQAPNVLQYGIRHGLNYLHTCRGYAGGRAIANVAKAIEGQRDKVVLGLKITWAPNDDAAMDAALALLGVDAVDIGFFNIHRSAEVRDGKYRDGAERWRKAGKIRHVGLTSHGDVKACMLAALDEGFYDVLMPSFNIGMLEDFKPVFERAAEKKLGITLMKTQQGLDAEAYARSVSTLLGLPAVTSINKTLRTFAEIDGLVKTAGATSARLRGKELERIERLAATGHCSMCGACTRACPHGLAVADMVRCSDYYLSQCGYGDMARETYAQIESFRQGGACADCGLCEAACPRRVPVRHHLRRADALLA